MSALSNLSLTATNGVMNSAFGRLFDFVQSKVANGGRDTNCKFYYSYGAGGSLLQVATKSIVGGVVAPLREEINNAFNSLIDGKKKNQDFNDAWGKRYSKADQERKIFGYIPVDGGVVYALDEWGLVSSDAIMLKIKLDHSIQISQKFPKRVYDTFYKDLNVNTENDAATKKVEFNSTDLVWYDTTAIINLSSDKNVIVTKIQGRDYSRKELVSNGDIKFSVSGQISSGLPDIYPTEEVQKFYMVMQYKGIVTVKNKVLAELGIDRILITDFSLSQREGFKSVQNYTFSAIGLQPAAEVSVDSDTVEIMPREEIKYDTAEDNGWASLMEKQLDALKSVSKDLFSQGTALASGMLDNVL